MCIAIYKEVNMELTQETLRNCWQRNPDGAGFMYAESGKVHIVRGLMTLAAFNEAFEPHKTKQAVIHFRIATHGGVNAENTHPFRVHDSLGMIHNGIINNVSTPDATKSDTWHFVDRFIKKYSAHWQDEEFQELIESYIGHSKLIFLDGEGNFKIYKENLGKWNSECWFSNDSWVSYVTPAPNYLPKTLSKTYWERSTDMKVGKVVTLLYATVVNNPDNDGEMIAPDTRVRITYFGSGMSVGIVNPINGKTAITSTWRLKSDSEISNDDLVDIEGKDLFTFNTSPPLKAGDEAVFTKNYNHFRIGAIVVVDRIAGSYVIGREKLTGKFQSIPYTHLAPASTLLFN